MDAIRFVLGCAGPLEPLFSDLFVLFMFRGKVHYTRPVAV